MNTSVRVLLEERLAVLADEVGAACAFVNDISGVLYAQSDDLSNTWAQRVNQVGALVSDELARDRPARGGHVRLVRSDDAPYFVAQSFAGVYLLVVLFDGGFREVFVLRRVQRALPEIEALVVALPPLDPQREAAVCRVRM